MSSFHLYRHTCSLIAVVLTFCFDPASAQGGGVSWEAVGISWFLSTLTTCILIAVAFGIKRCLKHQKGVKTSHDDEEGDVEQVERGNRWNTGPAVLDQHHIVTSPDKHNSGLLSVSQQSAYLRAQNDAGKNRKKSQPRRVKSEHEARDWVEQWCEEQAKRESVVAALQTVSDGAIPSANVPGDQMPRYPAGLDLPSTNIQHSTRNGRKEATTRNRTSSPAHIYAQPKDLQSNEFRKETALQKMTGQNLVVGKSTLALEDKQTVTNRSHLPVSTGQMATAVMEGEIVSKELLNVDAMPSKIASDFPLIKSQLSIRKTETIEELRSSPIRVRRHPRETQKQTDLPQSSAKTKLLEFKRPPNELGPTDSNEAAFHNKKDQIHKDVVVADKGEAKSGAPSQKQEATVSSSSSEEESGEDSEKEQVQPSLLRSSIMPSEARETLLSSQTRGDRYSISPSANEAESPEVATAVHPAKSSALSVVESTPPTPSRSTSVRRIPRPSKPFALNIVPVSSEGVSPPPGLLPLTASSHHQITRTQRQAVSAAVTVSHAVEDKIRRKASKKDEQRVVERRQKSSKEEKPKERPQPFDLKSNRASTGSDILFFAPELQGTSTPALRSKSAFLPASVPLLSDTADDEDDDDDEPLKGASSPKADAVAPLFLTQRQRIATGSRSHQFHGILSNDGLHELAHNVYREWRPLANSLQVPAELQAKLVESHSSDAEKCTYAMLRDWRDRFSGSKSEIRSLLCNALVTANHPEMAEKLIQEEMVGSSEKLDDLKLVSVV